MKVTFTLSHMTLVTRILTLRIVCGRQNCARHRRRHCEIVTVSDELKIFEKCFYLFSYCFSAAVQNKKKHIKEFIFHLQSHSATAAAATIPLFV